nr:zinc finger, CCHC-type [Tanacetum cinerariifolium]
ESDTLIDFQIKFSLSIGEIVTHWFTLIALSALRRSNNENMMSLMNLSILMDLQVTPTKPGRMTKPYSSYHFIANCFNAGNLKMEVKNPEEDQLNLIEEDLEPTQLIATIEEHHEVFLNERNFEPPTTSPGEKSMWYLDNGASNHMTGVKEHFKEIDEKITGYIQFGDGSYVEIKWKGSILLACKNKEQRAI